MLTHDSLTFSLYIANTADCEPFIRMHNIKAALYGLTPDGYTTILCFPVETAERDGQWSAAQHIPITHKLTVEQHGAIADELGRHGVVHVRMDLRVDAFAGDEVIASEESRVYSAIWNRQLRGLPSLDEALL